MLTSVVKIYFVFQTTNNFAPLLWGPGPLSLRQDGLAKIGFKCCSRGALEALGPARTAGRSGWPKLVFRAARLGLSGAKIKIFGL